MRLGVFDHMDRGRAPLDRFFEQRLSLIEAYDRAGFYGYHVAEHHATPLGVAPSPGVWLAAIAQRTRQLRFGPLVYLLPLYHPLKLLEEICMLDQMSGGRLLLGVGRGISPIELRYYGLDPEATPAMYAEALEVILQGMRGGPLTFEGQHYRFRDVPIELAPFQRPHPPLWYGIGRLDAIPWAVRHRVNVVGNLHAPQMRALTDAYRAEWRAQGHAMADLPLMGVGRHVVVAETEAEAMAIARRGYDKWRASFLKLWELHGTRPVMHAVFPERFEDAEEEGRAVAGAPDKVRDHLQRAIDEAGLNYLLCRFAFGDIALEESLHSLDLFTRQVKPHLTPSPETLA
ncbi:MAG: LLM class flavin-dependent oxidoreductase [Rhodospirillales bacterium]|nr:LLM class flavin-dependent oxidoreductase [Rhodospirillales bacterium]